MDSSSDGSFAWTDASNDTVDSGAMVNDNITKTHSEDESVSGKSYKKKLQEELFAVSNGDIKREEQLKPKERKRKLTEGQTDSEHVSPKKKKIKREPESDIDLFETKTNGHNLSVSDDCYYETYLDIKVKAEQELPIPSLGKTKKNRSKSILNSDNLDKEVLETEKKPKKKNKNHSCEENYNVDNKVNQLDQGENENLEKKRKKKKKTSKSRKDSLLSDETNHLESHMDVSEPIEKRSSRSPTQNSVPEANVTSYHDAVESDTKTNNSKFSLDDPENSRNGETPGGKPKSSLPFNKSVSLNAAVSRIPRISERIQFEEDECSEMETSQLQSSKTSIKSSKLKTYLKNNLNLKHLSSKLQTESVLTVDDEIWIVRCPKDVDIDAFQNKDFTLEGKCKLKLNGQTYEGTVDNEIENMLILSSDQSNFNIKSMPVKGFLNLRKRIPKCHMRDEVMVSTPNFIPLPETKCRHPLFGSNYRKAIKLPTAVAERLRTSSSLMLSTGKAVQASKHARKKKSHNSDHSLSTPKAEPDLELSVKPDVENDQSVSCKKKKKKQKHFEREEIAPKKKKRLKYDLESAEAWESEQAIEENLFNF